MVEAGADAILVETCQDLLQLKAAVLGSRRAMEQAGRHIPVFTHVTVETTGTMLLGSEIGAALTAIEPLGVDMIGLNCATGPAEMSEHLRYLSRHARIPVSVMPNAGLPVLGARGAEYPLAARRIGRSAGRVYQPVRSVTGRRLLRHHPRAHPESGRGRRPVQRRHRAARPAERDLRAGRVVVVHRRPVRAGRLGAGYRGADKRQRLQGFS